MVSNYSADEMRQAHAVLAKRAIPLASNQVHYSLLYRQPEDNGVMQACRELGVTLIAYQPLAMGALTGTYTAATKSHGLQRFISSFGEGALQAAQPVIDRLRAVGERLGKTPGQVALRWLIENQTVLPIPGVRNERQAQEDAGALSFRLGAEDIEELSHLGRTWLKR
jgi:aryl-alcohol dehydrogenase-like predicted oxidoreductase